MHVTLQRQLAQIAIYWHGPNESLHALMGAHRAMSLSNRHCSDSIKKLVSVKKFYLYRWNFANRKYVSIFSGTKIFLMTPSFCNLTIPGPDLCIHKTQMQYSLQTCQFLIAVNAKCTKSLIYYIQNNYIAYKCTVSLSKLSKFHRAR